ncbi:MAG: hypothetical protein ACFFC7_29035, partial [Candidatus Hermodarchaeota archaeon]
AMKAFGLAYNITNDHNTVNEHIVYSSLILYLLSFDSRVKQGLIEYQEQYQQHTTDELLKRFLEIVMEYISSQQWPLGVQDELEELKAEIETISDRMRLNELRFLFQILKAKIES